MSMPLHPTMYDERLVSPMRRELNAIGFQDLRTVEEVDAHFKAMRGTAMVVVNSVCGCSARSARPAVAMALRDAPSPDAKYAVFAGQDAEATQRARGYFTGYPPSSPSIAIMRDGQTVYMMERWQIEGRMPNEIAADLAEALRVHCAA